MDNRKNNGGKREGAGRKPKADELELIEKLSPLHDLAMDALKKGLENTFNWYFENMKYYTTLKKKDITKRLGVIKWLIKQ